MQVSITKNSIDILFSVHFLIILLVRAIHHRLHPGTVIQVPVYGLADSLLKGELRGPAQFLGDLSGINGIAAVVTESVFNKGDQ